MGNRVSNANDVRQVTVGIVSEADKKTDNTFKTSKYTLIGFPVQNLLEQFRRIANIYFLIVTVIAVLIDSPVSPMTSLAPMVFVIAVTMAKQGYEDWVRHRVDYAVNNELVSVIRNSTLQQIKCKEVRPGEVVRVERDCDVPCDAVLLCSSDPRGKCFVTTANLDGETSLKPLKVPAPLLNTTFEEMMKSKQAINIQCLQPKADIYYFHGKLSVGKDVHSPIGTENLMLRGSRIKNTEWAICCAVYTGKDTKLALNSRITRNKFTSCEAYINKYLLFLLVLMIIEIAVSFGMKRHMDSLQMNHESYLGNEADRNSFKFIAQDIFSFLLLYYYCIPISLYVTIEMQKFIGSLYLEWDLQLMCNETNQSAIANSSDLNEELGQIEILFSDKTGTLTKNDMYFQMCSVKGKLYIEKNKRLYEMNQSWERRETVQAVEVLQPDLDFFFTVLALCHTVQIEELPKQNGFVDFDDTEEKIPIYQSMSSDEVAFVKAAANRGIIFQGDDSNRLLIKRKGGEMQEYERLQVLQFTSARKRMSVIIKDSNGQIWLLCKGAENAVLPLCKDSPIIQSTNQHIQNFAEQGLRTLVVACKELTEEEYERINDEIARSNLDFVGRASNAGQNQWRSFEDGLTLLGATGVEDRLQDNVQETLMALRGAGIKIWVLTGDKIETAINVAQSCGHIPPKSEKMFLTEVNSEESLKEQLEMCDQLSLSGQLNLVLILDGQSFTFVMNSDYIDTFVEMSKRCEAVICCRLSPIQKAQIVRLIKKSSGRPITAAIGDGANDISMLQEAHVGFGIFGREGRQAARCADFAFTKFMMLKRILLVHGHWYYQRLATLIQYSFYKNLFMVNIMLFFQFHSRFSTQSIFDSMFLTFYNLAFTAAPPFALSLSEQCHDSRTLMNNPHLYKKQIHNKLLSWKYFLGWCGMALYHSVVVFYFLYSLWLFNPIIFEDGTSSGLWCLSMLLSHCVVCIVNLKIWLLSRYQSYVFILTVVLSILVFVLFFLIYTAVYFMYDGDVHWTYLKLFGSLFFWFGTTIIIIGCLFPDFVVKIYKPVIKKHSRERNDGHPEIIELTQL